MNQKRILLIEDDSAIRESLSILLQEEGYSVIEAANGQAALDCLDRDPHGIPSLILLDLMMPVMDGYTFRTRQLEDDRYSSIPVIILTAGNLDQNRFSQLNASACIRKPLEIDSLLSKIEAFVKAS